MPSLPFAEFERRKLLGEILSVPPRVVSVYSLTQHVWDGENDKDRRESKRKNKVRLETLDEFFIDPVRSYLTRIMEKIATREGQGFWVQAEFGVGKSHLLASSAIMAIGGEPAWEHVKKREDEERKAGPGARLDTLWRKKLEKMRLFPVVFSLEGRGGGAEKKLEDFILDEAQETFSVREGKPLAVYPEEHLARLFLKEHQKSFRDDLRTFLADDRLMRGLAHFEYDAFLEALKIPESQRDAGRVLMAFYRHKGLQPKVPTERGERLGLAVHDILAAGYDGVFIAIDEMSEYLRRSQHQSDDEDCLLTLSSTIAKSEGLPVWTLVAAQSQHTNPKKIIGPDRMREELLEHKEERFRDIVVQRTRHIEDPKAVQVYHEGYKHLLPWVKEATPDDFAASFPFPPDAMSVLRGICLKLTGTRSTISFLHKALKDAIQNKERELVPLWRIFPDLMSYRETPSTAAHGAISIRSAFRDDVSALEAAQATLKRITDGQLARPQNRSRAERILNTLFVYHLAGVAALTTDQILDAVCDLKPGEDNLASQRGHYETILDEMTSKLHNQIRVRQGRYEFVAKKTGQYDDLVYQAAERLKSDSQLLWQTIDRWMSQADPEAPAPFASRVPVEDWQPRRLDLKSWHGQERTGAVTAADLTRHATHVPEVDTPGSEDDFLIVLARRPMGEKAVEAFVKRKDAALDPRVVVWAPAEPKEDEKATLAGILSHLLVMTENHGPGVEKEARTAFRREAQRACTVAREMYARGSARTSRTSLTVSLEGGEDAALGRMASEAMDTCYKAKSIDFGNRKFDTTGAVNLLNALVKSGKAVSEGDKLWSAVENFAIPLGLVKRDMPKRLNPGDSPFYAAIQKRVQEHGAGLEVRTVYRWFTGYTPQDGRESYGLTRRMVDVYLLAMVQQGNLRLTQRKGGTIDRGTIAGIEFKPETLRGLDRVEMPRSLEHWDVFHKYLEVLLSRRPVGQGAVPEGGLGPTYDAARAEAALKSWWETDSWVDARVVEEIDRDTKALFSELRRPKDNPYDDLLLYWLRFADEAIPETFETTELYDLLRRAVLRAAEVKDVADLKPQHLKDFTANHKSLTDLQRGFDKTRDLLLQAAKLSVVPVPDGGEIQEIVRLQKRVGEELKKVEELVCSPDRVKARLGPMADLREKYSTVYMDALADLETAENDLEAVRSEVGDGKERRMLADLSTDLSQAQDLAEGLDRRLNEAPVRLMEKGLDRDALKGVVAREGCVKDSQRGELTLRRLVHEVEVREKAVEDLRPAGRKAATDLAEFLLSPGVGELLKGFANPSKDLKALMAAGAADSVTGLLVSLSSAARKSLAKELSAALGGRKSKAVRLSAFRPSTPVLWNAKDIDPLVDEFREYLKGQWDEGTYLKIE